LVTEDFTWKDPKAAQKAGMSVMDYVIGGMDRNFKLTLYHALRASDDAGFAPGITSGFATITDRRSRPATRLGATAPIMAGAAAAAMATGLQSIS